MADIGDILKQSGPGAATPLATSRSTAKRIPMSVPMPKLAVPEIPGYHQHWFTGDRVPRAIQAGYTFVDADETDLTGSGQIAGGENQDMGSRVSAFANSELDASGQPARLYLMKLPNELWLEDQQALESRSEKMLEALKVGAPATQPGMDNDHRYVPTQAEGNRNIFRPRKIRSA